MCLTAGPPPPLPHRGPSDPHLGPALTLVWMQLLRGEKASMLAVLPQVTLTWQFAPTKRPFLLLCSRHALGPRWCERLLCPKIAIPQVLFLWQTSMLGPSFMSI